VSRLPRRRKTNLTPAEIVAEAVRQYDASPSPPTIRSIAAELQVAPSAIYHHFPSRAALVRESVEAVWGESVGELLSLVPEPLEAEPEVVLVAAGVATRRVWCRHYRLAPYLAATPPETHFLKRSVALMGNLFRRLIEDPDEAAAAFHSYAAFMIGSVLFTATRLLTDEQLALEAGKRGEANAPELATAAGPGEPEEEAIHAALDRLVTLTESDPAGDEELFVRGLRRLVRSLTHG
jgi:AcrR family transcriptional regulator